jgi:hypothetical protein
MQLAEQLTDYVHAAFTGLWIQTSEADEAEREIVQHARGQGWKLAAWDVAGGLRFPNAAHAAATDVGAGDPWPCSARCRRWPSATAPPCSCSTTSTAS